MRIRDAVLDDVEALARIHVQAWRQGYQGIMPGAYLQALSVEKKQHFWSEILSRETRGFNKVLEIDGQPAGFCVYGPARDADMQSRNCCELIALNVSPDYWGQGVGRQLIEHVIEHGVKYKRHAVYLWVLKQNQRARALYESLGFVADGEERKERLALSQGEPVEIEEVRYIRYYQP